LDPQASELIEKCKQNVHEFCQLDASFIYIDNPQWDKMLEDLTLSVAKCFGCLSKIEARLAKFFVFKKGDHFLNRLIKEKKEEDSFGTLLFQLPSRYEGGELVLYERDGKRSNRMIDFGQKEGQQEFAFRFAAYFNDLEYEMLEVKSGYKLVLVYSLYYC
jgi:hypothetical protein